MHVLLILVITATASSCSLFASTDDVFLRDAATIDIGPDAVSDVGTDVDVSADAGDVAVGADAGDVGADVAIDLCGNGELDPGEACDGAVIQSDCEALGFGGGDLGCDANCEFSTAACFGCNVYIADTGDDAADGTTIDTPWASFAPLQALLDSGTSSALTACFLRGGEFHTVAALDVHWAGNRETKLTLRSYGDAANPAPILHGGVEVTFTQTDPVENLWEATVPFDTVILLLDDTSVVRHDNTPPLEVNSWSEESGVVTLHLPDGEVPRPGLYASHGAIINILAENEPTRFVDVRELDLRHSGSGVVVLAQGADLTNINIDHNQAQSIQNPIGVFGLAGRNVNLITIADNTLQNMDIGVSLGAAGQVDRVIVVERNVFAGGTMGHSFPTGVNIGNHSGARIQDNVFVGDRIGTGIYFNPFGSGKFLSAERNFVTDWGVGISSHMLGTPGNLTIANNIVTRCTTGISAGLGGSNGTGLIAHNTIHKTMTGLITYGGNVVLRNNVFSESETALRVNALSQLSSSNYNLFTPANPTFSWEMEVGDLSAWRAAGHDTLSVGATTAGFTSDQGTTAQDFMLLATSLAVDAGTPTAVTDDFGQIERVAPPDIGAWELR